MSKKKNIKTRDYAMVKIINGATKGGAHRNHKKEADKYEAREKVDLEDCIQCGFPLSDTILADLLADGFCSYSCMEYHTDPGGSEEE